MPNLPLDRTNPHDARRAIEKLLPNPEARRLVLTLIVDVINACKAKPASWGITLHHDGTIALNVGGGYYCVWNRGKRTSIFFRPANSDQESLGDPAHKSLAGIRCIQLSEAEIPERLPGVRNAVLDFVSWATERAGLLPLGCRVAHSPGVLRYIEQELNLTESLPNPNYPTGTSATTRRYWAFQANPDIFDIERAVREQTTDTWRVDNVNVKAGDRGFLWKARGSSATSGILVLTEVIEPPTIREPFNIPYFRKEYTVEEHMKMRVLLRYVQSSKLPIWKDSLPPTLADLSVTKGIQGNVFRVTEAQWEALMEEIGGWPETGPVDVTESTPTYPMNLILYGPPGTGKTYSSILRTVEIIDSLAPAAIAMEEAKPRWDELREAGQVELVTFHQSYGYEDFVEGIRPAMEDEAGETPRYEVCEGVLKRLSLRALGAMLEAVPAEAAGPVPFSVLWQALMDAVEQNPAKTYEGLTDATAFRFEISPKGGVKAWNVKNPLVTAPYATSLKKVEAVFNALRDAFDQVTTTQVYKVLGANGHHMVTAVLYRELKGIEKKMPASAAASATEVAPEERAREYLERGRRSGYRPLSDEAPRFVLVIDEINRGNISKIFGELITLIEDDKRIGADLALTVTLPHSREKFGLPSNLYLLGTMNTADKSIALVDVALRRRFDFEELMPDFGPETCPGLTPTMRGTLETLNRRIVLRKDRDHQIGHAFFCRVDSEDAFNQAFERKVIPLLQEYFYGDWDALRCVLGEDGASGRFVREIPGASSAKGARNRWQWYRDAGEKNMNCLAALVANYGLAG